MTKDLKLALFDYDGTIVDSAIMIVEGAIAAFRMCGLPDPDPKKVRENIGKPLAVALDLYMPPGYDITPEQISEAYRDWYAEQGRLGLQNEPLYSGMIDLLYELKANNWLIGVATNKSRIGLINGLAKHDISDIFDITLTTDENTPKPDPAIAFKAIAGSGFGVFSSVVSVISNISDILCLANPLIKPIRDLFVATPISQLLAFNSYNKSIIPEYKGSF